MANTIWNAADLSHITLSGGNLTATGSTIVSTPGGVRAVDPNASGKFYWEVRVTTWTAATSGVGISLAAANFANLANSGTSGMVFNRNGNVVMNSSNVLTGMGVQASGNTICLAVDVGARLFWVRSGIAGNWNNNVANNPATGVGGLSFSALGGAGTSIYPLITVGVNNDAFVADFGDTAFTGSVPAGFTSGFPAGGGGAALILDGTSPTGAWLMYRDLLTSFIGNTRYTTATGVNLLKDQSGNARNFDQSTAGAQSAVTTAGPNSRTCMDLDGVDDYLRASTFALSSLISASSGYIVISFIADAITTSAGPTYNNNPVLADFGGYMGLFMKSPNVLASFNWDGADKAATTTIATATLYVVEWRHDTGNLYIRINGGTETSVASGNTLDLTNTVYIGAGSTVNYGNIKFFEMASYSTVPALATRNAIVADFMAQQVAASTTAQVRVMVLA